MVERTRFGHGRRLYCAPAVLARDVRLEGFSTDDWVRLAEVFRARELPEEREDPGDREEAPASASDARAARAAAGGRKEGGVIAVTTAGKLRKLLGTRLGRLDLAAQPWPEPLEDLAERYAARWALELKSGALDELVERVAERLTREQDALSQIVLFVAVLRELEAEGRIRLWPWRLSAWPVPHERMLERALDSLCPDGKSMLLGIFQDGELFTAIVLRRGGSGFDLILGPEPLRRDMGLVSGDWRRDYRHLARAAEQAAGPLALGCFGELETLRGLLEKPSPGAWAGAVAARDVILSPAVPAVAIPLGIDVGRAAISAVRDLAERFGAGQWLSAAGPLAPALRRARELAGVDRDLRDLLGFDPFELLKKLLGRRGDRTEE
jgi:hypothetical protein